MDLAFSLNDVAGAAAVERVRFMGNGNVGIGITTPLQKLQVDGVVGSPASVGVTQSGIFRISNTTDNAVLDFGIRIAGNGAWIQSTDETSLAANYSLLLNPNGGNVGIGTTAPVQKLDIRGYVVSDVNSNAVEGGFFLGNNSHGIRREAGSNNVRLHTNGGDLIFGATGSGSQQVTLKNGGNLGIGTINPDYQLTVIGANQATANVTDAGNKGGSILVGSSVNATNQGGSVLFATLNDAGNYTPQWAIKSLFLNGNGSGIGDLAFSSRRVVSNTSLTESVRFTYDGKVGIGTNTPTTLLSVGGAGSTLPASGITFGGDASANLYRSAAGTLKTDGRLNIVGDASDSTPDLFFNGAGGFGSAGGQVRAFSPNNTTLSWYWDNTQFTYNNFPLRMVDGSSNTLVYFSATASSYVNGGNLGVGTSTPSGKLHVVSTVAGATVLRTDGTNGTLFSVVDDLSDSLMSVNNSAGLPVLEVFADDRVVAGQYGSGDFVLVNNKVGIGTSNPSYKLDVNGSLGINASTSDTNWPFVVSDNSSAGSRYGLNKVGSMGFNHADAYAQLQLLGTNGAYIDFTNSVGGDSNARLIYYAGNRLDLTYGFISKGTISLNSNGVGIGTTNPLWALDVSGTAIRSFASGAVEPGFIADYASSNGYGGFFVHADGTRKWRIAVVGDTNASPALSVWQEGVGARMSFRNNGNVGVGTTLPDNKLSIGVASDSALGTSSDGLRITDGTRNVQLLRNGTGYNYAGVVGSGSMLYSYDRMYIVADTSNPILFHAGGAERARVQANGNIGIGTTAPVSTLDVDNSVVNIPILNLGGGEAGNAVSDLYVLNSYNTNSGVGFAAKVIGVNISGSLTAQNIPLQRTIWGGVTSATAIALGTDGPRVGAQDNAFQIWTTNDGVAGTSLTQKFSVSSAGDVGIGVVNPACKLDVAGTIRSSTNEIYGFGASDNVSLRAASSVNVFGLYTNNTERLRVDANGYLGIGLAPSTLLSVGGAGSTLPASGLTFGGDAQANLYRSAEDTIKTDGSLIVAGNVTAANLVSGNGTANFITKWNGTKSIANSQIFDDGTYVGINTAVNTTYRLQVIGSFAATTKSFDIAHPTVSGKRLAHASLEGPENGVYFRGRNNNSEIKLPHYWSGLVHDDSITVDLTSIGKRKDGKVRDYSVDQIGDNKVYIYTDSDDNIYNYYYTIFAERKDVSKLVTERYTE
jgi:hypothetical protein